MGDFPADDLVVLVAFAGDQDDITVSRFGDRLKVEDLKRKEEARASPLP